MYIPSFHLDLSVFSVYPNKSYKSKNNVHESIRVLVKSELFDNHLKRYKLSKQVQSSLDKLLSNSKSPVKPDSDSKEIVNKKFSNKVIKNNAAKTKERFKIMATVSRDVIPLSWKQSVVYLVTCHSDATHTSSNDVSKFNSVKFFQLFTLLVEIEKNLLVNYNGSLALLQPLTNNLATLTILKAVFFKPLTSALSNKHHLQKSSLYHIYIAATKYKTKSANGTKEDKNNGSSVLNALSQTQPSIDNFIQSTGKIKRKHSEDNTLNANEESNNDAPNDENEEKNAYNNEIPFKSVENIDEYKTKRMRMTKDQEEDKEPEMMQKLRLMVERRRSSSRLLLRRSSSNLFPNSAGLMEDSSSCFPPQAFFNDDNSQLSPCKTSQISSQPATTILHEEDEDDVCVYDFKTEQDLLEYCEKCKEKAIEGNMNVKSAARRSIKSILKHYSVDDEPNGFNISSNGGDDNNTGQKIGDNANDNGDLNVKDMAGVGSKSNKGENKLDQKSNNDEDSDLVEGSFEKSKAYEMLRRLLICSAREVKEKLLNERDEGVLVRSHEWQVYLHCELHHQLQTRFTSLVSLHAQEICKHLRSISFIKDNSYVSSLVDATLCELYQQTCGRLMYRIYDELILPIPVPLRHLLSPDKFDTDSLMSPIKHNGAVGGNKTSLGDNHDEAGDVNCARNEENTSVKSDSRNTSLNSGNKVDGSDGCERRKDKTKALYSLFNYKNEITQKAKPQPSPSTSKSKSRALNRSISFSQKTLKIDMNSSRLLSLNSANPSCSQHQLRRHHRHKAAHKTPSRSRKSHYVLKTKRARETPEYKQGIDRYALKRKEVLSQSCMGDVPLEVQETPIKDQQVSGDSTLRRRTSFYSSQPLTRLSSTIPNTNSIVSSSKNSPGPKVEFFFQIDFSQPSHSNQAFNNSQPTTFKANLAPKNDVEALLNLASEKITFHKASSNKKPKSIFESLVSPDTSKSPQIDKKEINKENKNKPENEKRPKTERLLHSFINDSSNSSNSKSIGVSKSIANRSVKPHVSTPVRRITRNIFASHSNSPSSQSSSIMVKSRNTVATTETYKNLAINNNSNSVSKTASSNTSARKKRRPIEALIDENANDGVMIGMSAATLNKTGHHVANNKILFADNTNSSDAEKSTSISFKHFTRASAVKNNPQVSTENHSITNPDLDAILMRSPSTRRSIMQARRALLTSPEHKNTRSVKKLWA